MFNANLLFRYRQVTLPIEKHEHSRPYRREPSSLVLIGQKIGGFE